MSTMRPEHPEQYSIHQPLPKGPWIQSQRRRSPPRLVEVPVPCLGPFAVCCWDPCSPSWRRGSPSPTEAVLETTKQRGHMPG